MSKAQIVSPRVVYHRCGAVSVAGVHVGMWKRAGAPSKGYIVWPVDLGRDHGIDFYPRRLADAEMRDAWQRITYARTPREPENAAANSDAPSPESVRDQSVKPEQT